MLLIEMKHADIVGVLFIPCMVYAQRRYAYIVLNQGPT
jgi:hypothetical protein